jgi:hypothetical protein
MITGISAIKIRDKVREIETTKNARRGIVLYKQEAIDASQERFRLLS